MTEDSRPGRVRPLVLIVDDDDDSSELCAAFVRTLGFATSVANNALDAFRALERHPAAIIVDVAMSAVDGWVLIRTIRASPDTSDLPIIVLTGCVDEATRARATREGCRAFIPKPYRPRDLISTLTTLVLRAAEGVRALDDRRQEEGLYLGPGFPSE